MFYVISACSVSDLPYINSINPQYQSAIYKQYQPDGGLFVKVNDIFSLENDI